MSQSCRRAFSGVKQTIDHLASRSAYDDAMIPRSKKRMTLAGLKRHIDRRCATKADLRRFATKNDLRQVERRLETRMDVRFTDVHRQFQSLGDKIDALIRHVRGKLDHHDVVLDEHDERLRDLEARPVS